MTGIILPECPFGRDIIDRYIPHRDPMTFLTRVKTINFDEISAEAELDPNAEHFKGHFPGRPIMPGVLMVETAAQAGALLVAAARGLPEDKFLAFTAIDNVKIRKPAFPADCLTVDVSIEKARGVIYKFDGRISRDTEIVMTLNFTAALMDFPD